MKNLQREAIVDNLHVALSCFCLFSSVFMVRVVNTEVNCSPSSSSSSMSKVNCSSSPVMTCPSTTHSNLHKGVHSTCQHKVVYLTNEKPDNADLSQCLQLGWLPLAALSGTWVVLMIGIRCQQFEKLFQTCDHELDCCKVTHTE